MSHGIRHRAGDIETHELADMQRYGRAGVMKARIDFDKTGWLANCVAKVCIFFKCSMATCCAHF